MLNRDARRTGWPGAASDQQKGGAGAQQNTSALFRERAQPSPSKGKYACYESGDPDAGVGQSILRPSTQAACIEGLWSQAQLQTIFSCSFSDGNMW